MTVQAELEPLRHAEDEARKLLLTLIEKIRREPETETYHLLGYCYGTPLGGQLTLLLLGEYFTPQVGVVAEFRQILDNILSDVSQKLHLLKLKDELKSRVSKRPDQIRQRRAVLNSPKVDIHNYRRRYNVRLLLFTHFASLCLQGR